MNIRRLEVGPLLANCYIVACPATREAVVIDPGADAGDIIGCVTRDALKVRYIINTHGHADHIMANREVKEATGAEILIHTADAPLLQSAHKNLSAFVGARPVSMAPDRELTDGETIPFGQVALKVIHTPGHTPGGICLHGEGVLFTGDTLFAESIGRTDFPGGSYSQLIASIKEKLLVFPDDTKVLPGHGPASTIGRERRLNPFLV